jgi:catechol 2,3-dioxygenase-like lactoylglutathione lyase family enzyme
MEPTRIDHVVLYATDVDETAEFYERCGMERETFDDGRVAVTFGEAKINLHRAGDEYVPHARSPEPGAADVWSSRTRPTRSRRASNRRGSTWSRGRWRRSARRGR